VEFLVVMLVFVVCKWMEIHDRREGIDRWHD
jgi:hypothetical protein